MIIYINSLEIKLPQMSFYKLRKLAFEHYNSYWLGTGKYADIKTADRSFSNRIMMNFLRHECSCYEDELYNLFGKTGKGEGYSILKERINIAILKQFPMLCIDDS